MMMLHCFWAHDLRYGLAVQGSLGARASGHDGENFQLLPNSSTSLATDWLRVVKSLRALSSKFPHSPQTLPCRDSTGHVGQRRGRHRAWPGSTAAGHPLLRQHRPSRKFPLIHGYAHPAEQPTRASSVRNAEPRNPQVRCSISAISVDGNRKIPPSRRSSARNAAIRSVTRTL